MRPLVLIAGILLIARCDALGPRGSPCGDGQFADAQAILPDTGINAGDTLSVVFTQHDTNELTELVIWHLWPFSTGIIDPEPDPRVRIVREDGRVLLDSIGSRYNQPEDKYNRPTWYVFMWIRDAELRNAFFEGFRDETLWVELWHVGASRPGTRVRLVTDRVGIEAPAICL